MPTYTISTDLPSGLLIHAQGEWTPTVHVVRHAAKLLEVMAVDLSGSTEQTRTEVGEVAAHIRSMCLACPGHMAA